MNLGGVSAEELAEEFGTPLYVYEEDIIREKCKLLSDAIAYNPKKLLFACKANSSLAVLKVILSENWGVDAVSPGEVFLALEAGFPKEDILFTGNNMSDSEMEWVHKKGVLLNIGSLSRLEKYGKAFPGSDVCVRVCPDVNPDVHPHLKTGGLDSKFGIWIGEAPKIREIASKYDLKIVGIHAHIGTTIMDLVPFKETMNLVLSAAKEFSDLDFVDFGGGIGVQYKPGEPEVDIKEFGRFATEKMEAFSKAYGKKVEYRIEPGRYSVCSAGVLLGKVNTIKKNPQKTFIGLDANMAHLVRPSMYGAYHHIENASNMECQNGPLETVDVVGNICETGDFFAKDRKVEHAEEGDIIAIENAGAYGFSMASNYNSFLKPAEVMVSGGKARLIRARAPYEALLEGQIY